MVHHFAVQVFIDACEFSKLEDGARYPGTAPLWIGVREAIETGCNPVAFGLRRCKSYPFHHVMVCWHTQ